MADEAITSEPTYTAISDDILMVKQDLSEPQDLIRRSLIHIFNFRSRQITTIYEATTPAPSGGYSGGNNISTNMEISQFSARTNADLDYTRSMRAKLEELLNPPDEPETEPTLDHESRPFLTPNP